MKWNQNENSAIDLYYWTIILQFPVLLLLFLNLWLIVEINLP